MPVETSVIGESSSRDAARKWLSPGVAGICVASFSRTSGTRFPRPCCRRCSRASGRLRPHSDSSKASRTVPRELRDSPAADVDAARPSAATRRRRSSRRYSASRARRGKSLCCGSAPGRRAGCACRRATRCSRIWCRRTFMGVRTVSSAQWTTLARLAVDRKHRYCPRLRRGV